MLLICLQFKTDSSTDLSPLETDSQTDLGLPALVNNPRPMSADSTSSSDDSTGAMAVEIPSHQRNTEVVLTQSKSGVRKVTLQYAYCILLLRIQPFSSLQFCNI